MGSNTRLTRLTKPIPLFLTASEIVFRLQPVYSLEFRALKNLQEIPEKGTFEGSDVAGARLELATFGL
jgi:hypothetical protein